jgi:hypothetical protein
MAPLGPRIKAGGTIPGRPFAGLFGTIVPLTIASMRRFTAASCPVAFA